MKNFFSQNKKGLPLEAKRSEGFTLVEVMVAVGLFVVVAIISITAVLSVNSTHRRTREYRQALDSVNFLMEDMSRNIRLGMKYHCDASVISDVENNSLSDLDTPIDCWSGSPAISFEGQNGDSSTNTDQVAYMIAPKKIGSGYTVYKKNQDSEIMHQVLPEEIFIDQDSSHFITIGALPGDDVNNPSSDPTDQIQPRVNIVLSGYVVYKGENILFNIQTTVTQRLIDA